VGEKNAGHACMPKHFYRAAYMSVKKRRENPQDFLMYARRFPKVSARWERRTAKLLLVF